jgi:hypothetical protein
MHGETVKNLEEIMNFQNWMNIIIQNSDISNKYDARWLAKTWRLQLRQKKKFQTALIMRIIAINWRVNV